MTGGTPPAQGLSEWTLTEISSCDACVGTRDITLRSVLATCLDVPILHAYVLEQSGSNATFAGISRLDPCCGGVLPEPRGARCSALPVSVLGSVLYQCVRALKPACAFVTVASN